jgi:hypothetical protein
MPTISIENTVQSQALRGQNVKITVDLTTQSNEFNQINVGDACVDNNSGFTSFGYIYSIDRYGNSFEICPNQPNFSFTTGNGTFGYFDSGYSVDVTV